MCAFISIKWYKRKHLPFLHGQWVSEWVSKAESEVARHFSYEIALSKWATTVVPIVSRFPNRQNAQMVTLNSATPVLFQNGISTVNWCTFSHRHFGLPEEIINHRLRYHIGFVLVHVLPKDLWTAKTGSEVGHSTRTSWVQWMDCRVGCRFEWENPRWFDVSMSDQRVTNWSANVYDLCSLKNAGLLVFQFVISRVLAPATSHYFSSLDQFGMFFSIWLCIARQQS